MSIPESVIDAARIEFPRERDKYAKARARRVILALAEEMPAGAVSSACDAVDMIVGLGGDTDRDVVRAAIAAFLKHVAGDSP
jgi:hypothetical protein